ncbi:MAG: MBL fold metallo-hydrolase [Oscillospiraceae bacterium]|nr:MBL fold metallo-hydrolase [Oscillospiraceae bacterium]
MMRIHVFSSGSGGNCLLLVDNDTKIMIDAGISKRRTEAALTALGYHMADIGGVLITHEHSDHIYGLVPIVKCWGTPVYAPHTVANRLRGAFPVLEEHIRIVPTGAPFLLGGLQILAFHTSHDTDESVGYRIEGSAVYGHATDTGVVTDEMRDALRGADTVLLESNHDEQLLRDGPYPFYLKKRILSERGHLSNAACAAFARELAESGTRRIVLAHLSQENNRPELAMAETERALRGTGAELFCAPVSGCLTVEVEGIACSV